jgi:hypothetical protein
MALIYMALIQNIRMKAKRLHLIDNDDELQESTRKNKRYMILHNGKWIHFGVPYDDLMVGTYADHGDKNIRKAWRARHKKIMKNDKPAYKDKTSP